MTLAIVRDGAQIAPELRTSSTTAVPTPVAIRTTGDVLASPHALHWRRRSMLKTVCGHLGTFLNLPGDAIPLFVIEEKRSGFRRFLESRRFAETSVSTYIDHVRQLLKLAKRLGWDPDQIFTEPWREIVKRAAHTDFRLIVRHFAHRFQTPSGVTLADVECWGEAALQEGISYQSVVTQKSRFWRLLQETGWTEVQLPSQSTRKPYGVPLEQFPSAMRREVETLLKWKQADFAINRPKNGKIRAVSAEALLQVITELAGFVVNIQGRELGSFSDLVRRDFLEGFVEWKINERGSTGATVKSRIGMIAALVKNHPMFSGGNHEWFKTLADSIPVEDESERRKRKAERYLEYEVLETVPALIRAQLSLALRKQRSKRAAALATEELLMKWLLILPWRQRNIRECRIGGRNPNIFRGKIQPYVDVDRPAWVREEEARNPDAEFWQIHFSPSETKTKVEVRAVLPQRLVKPMEEYIATHRPELLAGKDTPNLFVNQRGDPFKGTSIQRIVESWTFRRAGVRMNPHQARDSFAFKWLKEHPRDFLLLSKILWHKNVQTTIQIYGAKFNVSSGMCAMEEWLDDRYARAA